jgi:hypothetical protein
VRLPVVAISLATCAASAGCGLGASDDHPEVRVSTPDRAALLAGDRVGVAVRGEAGERVRVEMSLEGEAPIQLTHGRSLRLTGRTQRLALGVARSGRAGLADCARTEARVTLRLGTDTDGDPAASETVRLRDSGPPCGRFFSRNSAWNQEPPADAALHPQSDRLVGELLRQARANIEAHYGPDISASDYSTAVYTVARSQRRVAVRLPPEKRAFSRPFRSVPLPDDARPAEGTDNHLVVWQPGTDTMWEFYGLQRRGGRWTADWGGRLPRVSRSAGVFKTGKDGVKYGATATGLPLAGGLITLSDLRKKRIDHALALAIPEARAGVWSLPAQRTDGKLSSRTAIPEGARFRLDPRVDLDALQLPQVTRMVAEAAQRYGMILRDQAGVVQVYAEIPQAGGDNPLAVLKEGVTGQELMAKFPWDRLQLLRMDLRRR